MTSSTKVQNEVVKLRKEVMYSFRETLPSKEFCTRMILALAWMHMLAKRIETSSDLSERRKLLQDFTRGKNLIKHWTEVLRQTRYHRAKVGDAESQDDTEVSQTNQNGIGALQKSA